MRRLITVLIAAAAYVAVLGGVAGAENFYWRESSGAVATYVYRYTVTLQPCTLNTFKTRNLSVGADTVMFLTANNVELSWNNDFQGLKSQITYFTSCTDPAQVVTAWVRANSNDSGGGGGNLQFEFVLNNTSLGFHRLGGYILKSGNVTNATDTMETVFVNNGAARTVLIRFVNDGTHYKFNNWDTSSGVGAASKLAGTSATDEQWVIATPAEGYREGPVRVVRNDVATTDSDLDGLGNGLEAEACTCASPTSIDRTCNGHTIHCSQVLNKQDTDGDGLFDSWEVTGRDGTLPQSLPLWGASPIHKDVFVEVDADIDDPAPHALPESMAIDAAGVYARLPITNFDDVTGVAVHFDTGGLCQDEPGDVDNITNICGDFSGYSLATWIEKDSCGSRMPLSMNSNRLGMFHWMMRTPHERGHTSSECSWVKNTTTASDAYALIAHELGHQFGLEHWGANAAGVANRKPMYLSIMNYAYTFGIPGAQRPAQFSSGDLASYPLDATNLSETVDFGGNVPLDFLTNTGSAYDFDVDSSNSRRIDWNRDGEFNSSVRAHVAGQPNARDYGGDDLPGMYQQTLIPSLQSNAGVGATFLNGWSIVVAKLNPPQNSLYFTRTLGLGDVWYSWSSLSGSPTLRDDSSPVAATYDAGDGQEMYVLGIDKTTGHLRYGAYDAVGTPNGAWGDIALPPGVVAREVGVAVSPADGRMYVALTNITAGSAFGEVWLCWFNGTAWSNWSRVEAPSGTPVTSRDDSRTVAVTPGIAMGPDGRLYMITRLHDSGGVAQYEYTPSTASWANGGRAAAPGNTSSGCPIVGRIGALWRPYHSGSGAQLPYALHEPRPSRARRTWAGWRPWQTSRQRPRGAGGVARGAARPPRRRCGWRSWCGRRRPRRPR